MTRLFFNEYFKRKVERLAERQDEKLFTLEETDVNNFEFISVDEHLEKIQKRDAEIEKLKGDISSHCESYKEHLRESVYAEEIEKRDKLLEQAIPWIQWMSEGGLPECAQIRKQWLKNYQELLK